MHLLVIYGPGQDTPVDLDHQVTVWGRGMGVTVESRQSDNETLALDWITRFEGDGIVCDPAGFTDGNAIAEALDEIELPVVEVHRDKVVESPIGGISDRRIYGRGLPGYRDAMRHLVNRTAMPFETFRYGADPDNVGDMRGDGDQMVVLVHGGFWRQEYERDTTESLAVDLAKRGYRTWNLEYRRLGDGGGWPGSGDDVLAALDSIPAMGLTTGRVSVIGHSAGSYLLMWAAGEAYIEIDLHIALAPVLDLEAAVDSGDVGAEECRLLLKEGAPRLSPGEVRTALVHGDSDQIVPIQRSVDFSKRHSVELRHSSCDHFSLLDPTRAEWEWVPDRLASR